MDFTMYIYVQQIQFEEYEQRVLIHFSIIHIIYYKIYWTEWFPRRLTHVRKFYDLGVMCESDRPWKRPGGQIVRLFVS